MVVGERTLKDAAVPLPKPTLVTHLKFFPVIVMVSNTLPMTGEKDSMIGSGNGI